MVALSWNRIASQNWKRVLILWLYCLIFLQAVWSRPGSPRTLSGSSDSKPQHVMPITYTISSDWISAQGLLSLGFCSIVLWVAYGIGVHEPPPSLGAESATVDIVLDFICCAVNLSFCFLRWLDFVGIRGDRCGHRSVIWFVNYISYPCALAYVLSLEPHLWCILEVCDVLIA